MRRLIWLAAMTGLASCGGVAAAPEPADPRLLLTEPGVGYRLVEPED